MSGTKGTLLEALSGWNTLFGIVLAATAIVNILINTFRLEPLEVLAAFLEGYRGIFHYPLRAAEALLGIHIPPIARDGVVLWLIGAGSTLRMNRHTYNANDFKAQFGLWTSIKNAEWRRPATYSNFRCSIILNFYHPVWRTVVGVFSWPLLLRILFRRTPIIFVAQAGRQDHRRHYVYAGPEKAADLEADGYQRGFDLRKIFWTQVLAAVLIAIVTATTGGLGTGVIKSGQ